MRILVTGGSGFIGTNAVDKYKEQAEAVLSIDIRLPRKSANSDVHQTVDIRDAEAVRNAISAFKPTHLLHLAAKTGMDEDDPEVFSANTKGTQNVIDACVEVGTLKHAIFTSSLLVCELGYIPSHEEDYCPPNLYGESKRDMEVLIRQQGETLPFTWTIIRPTAIWGPWFEMPYNLFFEQYLEASIYILDGRTSQSQTATLGMHSSLYKRFSNTQISAFINGCSILSTTHNYPFDNGQTTSKSNWAAPGRYPHCLCQRFMGLRRPERFSKVHGV